MFTLHDDFGNETVAIDGIIFNSINGIAVNVQTDAPVVQFSGNFLSGHGIPTTKPNDVDSTALYLEMDLNQLYIWHSEKKSWVGPFSPFIFTADPSANPSYEIRTGVLNLPTVLAQPAISIKKNYGLVQEVSAKNSLPAYSGDSLTYKWNVIGDNIVWSVDEKSQDLRLRADKPQRIIVELTAVSQNGTESTTTLPIDLSYDLHVNGFDFSTLYDTMHWIRENGGNSQYNIYVEIETDEHDKIYMLPSTLIFTKHGKINKGLIYDVAGSNNTIISDVQRTLINTVLDDAITIRNGASVSLINGDIISDYSTGLNIIGGSVTFNNSNISSLIATSATINATNLYIDGKTIVKNSDLNIYHSLLNDEVILENTSGKIVHSEITVENKDNFVAALRIKNRKTTNLFKLIATTVNAKFIFDSKFISTGIYIAGNGEVVIESSDVIVPKSIGIVTADAENLSIVNSRVNAKFPHIENREDSHFFLPVKEAVNQMNIINTSFVGK